MKHVNDELIYDIQDIIDNNENALFYNGTYGYLEIDCNNNKKCLENLKEFVKTMTENRESIMGAYDEGSEELTKVVSKLVNESNLNEETFQKFINVIKEKLGINN